MAHTLTINDQYTGYWAVTVNGNDATSPYTLQNGDIIKVPTLTQGITINGTSYDMRSENVLNISDEDITVIRTGAEKTVDPVPYITINYTESATPTLTFKHFYDAGTIGSGTVKFRHYSQQEPSSGETWVLNETLKGEPYGLYNEYATIIDFTSNGENFTKIGVDNDRSTSPWIRYYTNSTENLVYSYGKWTNTAYRTITFAKSPTGDLLTWLQANGTKQGGGATLINFTIDDSPITGQVQYQAEEGMTWQQFVNSSYNTNNLVTIGPFDNYSRYKARIIYKKVGRTLTEVTSTDVIIANEIYETGSGGSGGSIQ